MEREKMHVRFNILKLTKIYQITIIGLTKPLSLLCFGQALGFAIFSGDAINLCGWGEFVSDLDQPCIPNGGQSCGKMLMQKWLVEHALQTCSVCDFMYANQATFTLDLLTILNISQE